MLLYRKHSLIFFAALIATISGVYLAHTHHSSTTSSNQALIKLLSTQFPMEHGGHLTSKHLVDKILVINFWAPWCSPCIEEIPDLITLQHQFSTKQVLFLGIGIDSADNIQQLTKKIEVNYPLLVAGLEGLNFAKSLGNTHKILPFTVVINKNGTILMRKIGKISKDELNRLLLKTISIKE